MSPIIAAPEARLLAALTALVVVPACTTSPSADAANERRRDAEGASCSDGGGGPGGASTTGTGGGASDGGGSDWITPDLYPVLASSAPPADADADGMPDDWEAARGLNPDDPEDRNGDRNCNGYTDLEDYLNGLAGN